jgi:hypothetical protein
MFLTHQAQNGKERCTHVCFNLHIDALAQTHIHTHLHTHTHVGESALDALAPEIFAYTELAGMASVRSAAAMRDTNGAITLLPSQQGALVPLSEWVIMSMALACP